MLQPDYEVLHMNRLAFECMQADCAHLSNLSAVLSPAPLHGQLGQALWVKLMMLILQMQTHAAGRMHHLLALWPSHNSLTQRPIALLWQPHAPVHLSKCSVNSVVEHRPDKREVPPVLCPEHCAFTQG